MITQGLVAFSVRAMKYWNKPPASLVLAASMNIFKEGLEKFWTEIAPHLSLWQKTHIILAPLPPCTPPINSAPFYPFMVCLVTSGLSWPTFYNYKTECWLELLCINQYPGGSPSLCGTNDHTGPCYMGSRVCTAWNVTSGAAMIWVKCTKR